MKSRFLLFMVGMFVIFFLGCECGKERPLIEPGDAKPDGIEEPKKEEPSVIICVDPETGEPGRCDDNIFCSRDICDKETQRCKFIPDHNLCEDGLFCTDNKCVPENEKCKEKGGLYCCKITKKKCTKPVGTPDCVESVCVEEEKTCKLFPGKCPPGQYCDLKQGCKPLVESECSRKEDCPKYNCFEVNCENQKCNYRPKKCPAKGCTLSFCDPKTGNCKYLPDHSQCQPKNECQKGRCDPGTGQCQYKPDHSLCQTENKCKKGRCDIDKGCIFEDIICPSLPCTTSSCNSETGKCEYTPLECPSNIDCVTGYCDPTEGRCKYIPNHSLCPDDGDYCTVPYCELEKGCTLVPFDRDKDGEILKECGGTDCDDFDPDINSQAQEICDDKDNDCDGHVDEGLNTARGLTLVTPDETVVNEEDALRPAIAWNGTEYGVVWQDKRGGSFNSQGIFFARVREDGTLILNSEVEIDSSIPGCYLPSLAWDGSSYGLVCSSSDEELEIEGTFSYYYRLNESGEIISSSPSGIPGPIPFPGCPLGPSTRRLNPSIIFNPDHNVFAVVFRCVTYGPPYTQQIRFCLISSTDEFTCQNVSQSGNFDQVLPRVVWNGESYGVVWQDWRSGSWDIYFNYLDSSGVRQLALDRAISAEEEAEGNPSMVWIDEENRYGVIWETSIEDPSEERLYFRTVTSAGEGISDPIRVREAGTNPQNPSLIWTGADIGLAWQEEVEGTFEVFFARMNSSGQLSEPIQVSSSSSSGASHYPDLIWHGNQAGGVFAVAFHDNGYDIINPGNWDIIFTRIICGL